MLSIAKTVQCWWQTN